MTNTGNDYASLLKELRMLQTRVEAMGLKPTSELPFPSDPETTTEKPRKAWSRLEEGLYVETFINRLEKKYGICMTTKQVKKICELFDLETHTKARSHNRVIVTESVTKLNKLFDILYGI